jgi:hypothetical protein
MEKRTSNVIQLFQLVTPVAAPISCITEVFYFHFYCEYNTIPYNNQIIHFFDENTLKHLQIAVYSTVYGQNL